MTAARKAKSITKLILLPPDQYAFIQQQAALLQASEPVRPGAVKPGGKQSAFIRKIIEHYMNCDRVSLKGDDHHA